MQILNRSISRLINLFKRKKESDPFDRFLKNEITLGQYLKLIRWRCDVCRDYRTDKHIDVITHDINVITKRNVKYCNDRLECFEAAHILDRWI